MTPTRSRTIIPVIASLAFGTLMAGPALGALSASPNPSTTGSYTVSDASPPALAADVTVGNPRRFHTYRLVETAPGGASNTYSLGRGPVSRSFTDQPPGTYTYQLQSCALILLIRAGELVDSNPCSNLGGSLSVTVTPPSPADPMPDFGTATVAAKGWTRNSPIAAFTVPAATGGDAPLSYSDSGLPAGVSMSSARLVSGTPTAAGMGTATVTVRDKDGDTDTLSFAWTVAAPATPDLMPDFGDASIADQSWTLNTHITFVNVPAATGGDGTLKYSGSGLPAGVRFLTTTRVVLGRPTEAGSGTFTVTAADADGDTDTLSFDWTVVDPMPDFGDAPVSGKSWRVGQPIAAFYVPAASGGNSPLGYAATGLPGGVTMSAARRVSGTPTAAGSGTATVTVTDSDGDTDTLDFGWTVNEDLMPSFGTASVDDKDWTLRTSIAAFTVPAASGGDGTLRYSVSGLPRGVRMASSTRRVSGYPTGSDASSGTATVTVRDADGDTGTLDFNWSVEDPMPDFGSASVPAKAWSRNNAIPRFTVPAATGGNPPLRYSAAGLPDGVAMSSLRRVSGTPTAAGSGAATVTVRDYDGDTDTLSFDWTVSPEDLMPDFGAAAVTDQYWVTGSALRAPAVPAASGGNPPLSYAAAGLPRGVSMSSARSISGTPLWAAAGTATITVADVDGDTDTLSFDWTTYDPLRLPVLSSKNWTQNRAIVPFGVAAAGGVAPLAHTVGGLPAGVTASSSGSVSGTPTGTGSGTATVTVTDDIGNTRNGSFTWRVATEPVDLTPSFSSVTVSARSWTQHEAIAAFTVPAASGGDGTLTYSATGLPAGVTMSSSRAVSGTPTAAGSGTAIVTARDTDGDTDTVSFNWTVSADLKPSFATVTLTKLNWTEGQAVATFTVPAASGGDGTLNYAAGGLPSGVSMDSSRTVSGTPDRSGSGTATVTATDADGDTASVRFAWTVSPGPNDRAPSFAMGSVAKQQWLVRRAIAGLTVPAASGGDGTLTYTASGLPAGVTMSSARVVSGSPAATGSGTATVTVTDADGDFAKLSFDWAVVVSTPVLSATPTLPRPATSRSAGTRS